jgi:hypothetical protein
MAPIALLLMIQLYSPASRKPLFGLGTLLAATVRR